MLGTPQQQVLIFSIQRVVLLDKEKIALLAKFFRIMGTPFRAGHFVSVTAETPPPVQAAGDTIPKGLRSPERRPFFLPAYAIASGGVTLVLLES
jgi:hypothetical protein